MLRIPSFARLCCKAPDELLLWVSLSLHEKSSWIAQVMSHLEGLARASDKFSHAEGWRPSQWACFFKDHGLASRKAVVAACSEHRICSSRWWAVTKSQAAMVTLWPCVECGVDCGSRQQLAVHTSRKHGLNTSIRAWVRGTCCEVCLVEFHTRDRLVAHLAYRSEICRLNVLRVQQPLSDDELKALDVAARGDVRVLVASGRRRCHAVHKCFRTCGPLPLTLDPADVVIAGAHPLGAGRKWHSV